MPENFITREVCQLTRDKMDERFQRDLKILDRQNDQLTKLTEVSAKLAGIVDRLDSRQEDIETRLREIERKPGVKWDKLIWAAVTLALGAMFGLFTAAVGI